MKRNLFSVVFLAALALAAVSCNREEPDGPDGLKALYLEQPSTVQASLDNESDTKTDFQMNAAGTFGQILWTSGDSFRMFGFFNNGSQYYTALYTTTASGSSSATFTSSSSISPTVDDCYSLYPAFTYTQPVILSTDSGTLLGFYLSIPATQQATAGKPDPNTHRSFAWSKTPTQAVKFKNLTALVKFRLSGESVSNLASIILQTGSLVAGDCCITHLENGQEPKFWQLSGSFNEPASTSVTLKGPFQTDTDYYIATYPEVLSSGMTLVFKDKDNNTSSKTTYNSVSLKRSRILDLGTLAVTEPGKDPDVVTWHKGPAGKAPTLCVIADGFTATQQNLFVTLASSAMQTFFDTEPFKTYKEYFNVYLIKAVSNQSGGSITDGNGHIITKVDNFFGTAWGEDSYNDMACNEEKVKNFVSAKCPAILAGNNTIDEVTVIIIVNDHRYGGICHVYSSGMAIALVPYTYGGSQMASSHYPETEAASVNATSPNTRTVTQAEIKEMGTYVGDWRNTLLHEGGGHGFGRFKDEYWYGPTTAPADYFDSQTWPVPYGLNLSGDISASSSRYFWKEYINNPTLLAKDSRYGRIGTFQGGGVFMFGAWRSERISCMIDNRQYFSFWQRYLIVDRIMKLAGQSYTFDTFLAKDTCYDPVRDGASNAPAARSATDASGRQDNQDDLPLMPLLPPPVLHIVE
jgi:hypothetical protein